MRPDKEVLHPMTTSKAYRDIDLQELVFIEWREWEDDHKRCIGSVVEPIVLPFAAFLLGIPFNYWAPRGEDKYSRLCGGIPSSLCLYLIWWFKCAILPYSPALQESLGVPPNRKRRKTYQSFAGQYQRSGFRIRSIWPCRSSAEAKANVLKPIGQLKLEIGNIGTHQVALCTLSHGNGRQRKWRSRI